jgi:uncharacterized protein YgbK (DUF1537 family)
MPGTAAPELALVADDLTGAFDAAVAFAREDGAVHVGIGALPPSAPVVATSTGARDGRPDDAAAVTALAVRTLREQGIPRAFVKLDSRLRGPAAAIVEAAAEAWGSDVTLVAPALPSEGRGLLGATLTVGGTPVPGQRLEFSDDARVANVPVGPVPDDLLAAVERAVAGGARIVTCDGSTHAHLAAVAEAARKLDGRVLLAGSSGLARAMAGPAGAAAPLAPVAGVLFVLGSPEPVLRAQLARLLDSRADARVVDSLGSGPPSAERDDGTLAAQLARKAAEVIRGGGVGAVVCIGGAVAAEVCRELGISAVRIVGDLGDGLVVSRGLPSGDLLIAVRSGGFGPPDHLVHAHDVLLGGTR